MNVSFLLFFRDISSEAIIKGKLECFCFAFDDQKSFQWLPVAPRTWTRFGSSGGVKVGAAG